MKFVFGLLIFAACGSAVTVNSVPVVKKDLKLEEIRDIQEIPKLVINNGYEHTGYQPIDSHASQELQEIMYNELEAIKKVQPLENDNNKSNVKHYVIIQKLKFFTIDLIVPAMGMLFVALIDLLILHFFKYYPRDQKNKYASFYFYMTAILMVIVHFFFVFFFYKFTRLIQDYCSEI